MPNPKWNVGGGSNQPSSYFTFTWQEFKYCLWHHSLVQELTGKKLTFRTLRSSLVISRPLMKTSVRPLLASGLSFPVKFKFELMILSGFSPSCKIASKDF